MSSLMKPFRGLFLAAVVVVVAAVVCGAQAKNLYPECEGQMLEATANAGSAVTVMYDTVTSGTTFSITCFAHEVTAAQGNQKDPTVDHCKVAHQTEYPYRLAIRATYTDDDGVSKYRYFNLRDVGGSSVDGVTIHMDHPSRFSAIFTNEASTSECVMSFRALLTYKVDTPANKSTVDRAYIPTAVAVRPSTIYPGQTVTMVLQLPPSISTENLKWGGPFLLPLHERCASPTTRMSMDSALVPYDFSPLNGDAYYTAASKYFRDTGSYRVCFESNMVSPPVELAVLTSFTNNPAYFDVVDGADAQGMVMVGMPITIKFFGSELDTRPNGDQAKLADEEDTCSTEEPAGGVPVGTDLGPSDNYGPNTTYSLWNITIRMEGGYKLCYKRATSDNWAEVPYISTVDPGTAASDPTTSSVPVPRNADTGKACPMAAAAEVGKPWIKYKSVKLVMSTTKSVEELANTISQLFCVPRAAFALTRLTHNKEKEQVVHFSFLCDNVTAQGRPVCDNTERGNYAAGLGSDASSSSLLKSFQIKSIAGSTSMAASGDDPSTVVQRAGSALSTLFICLTVLGVAAIVAYTVMKYREKRQYMVQFGMDDGDIDDMYATGPVSLNGAMGTYPAARYELGPMTESPPDRPKGNSGGTGTRDAVIEIED